MCCPRAELCLICDTPAPSEEVDLARGRSKQLTRAAPSLVLAAFRRVLKAFKEMLMELQVLYVIEVIQSDSR